jgi:hypothetical protein
MASWLLFPVSPVLSFLAAGIAFFQSFPSSCRLVRTTLLSPFVVAPVFFAFKGMHDYSHGRAVMFRIPACGAAACERDAECSIDPKTRLPMADARGRCGNFMTLRVYNRMVRFLSREFGPQPGAWTGPLPGRSEAQEAALDGEEMSGEEFRRFPELAAIVSSRLKAKETSISMVGVDADARIPQTTPLDSDRPRSGALRGGLRSIAWGPEFVLVYDAVTGREIARWGDPPRTAPLR